MFLENKHSRYNPIDTTDRTVENLSQK